MKTIEVVAAIIKKDDKIFITKRSYGEFIDMWEFPGGKVEVGETQEEALIREIKEELELDITNLNYLTTVEYDYPKFHLSMDCFWCELQSEHVVLNEHEDAKWLSKAQLDSVDWLPADVTLVDKIAKGM